MGEKGGGGGTLPGMFPLVVFRVEGMNPLSSQILWDFPIPRAGIRIAIHSRDSWIPENSKKSP